MIPLPPTDPRANLTDTVAYLRTIASDAGRLARALAVHQKTHAGDHQTRSALSRCQTASEDFARTIDHALANLSTGVRDAIERG